MLKIDSVSEENDWKVSMAEYCSTIAPITPGLYIVATPIGNLADLSIRALKTLQSVDVILCEDTRHTSRLLEFYQIKAQKWSLNENNEAKKIPEIIEKIQQGQTFALVSDAGTPLISDPGQRLVQQLVKEKITLVPIPGASAVTSLLSVAGLPSIPYYFGGFLTHSKGARRKILEKAMQSDATSVFFESPYRILDTLQMITEIQSEHLIVVAREMTKKFEEIERGTAQRLLGIYQKKTAIKGEITLAIAPTPLPKWIHWKFD
jgi:16S rRNA (cytidine1402-2'-O)-methyltransferase